MLVVDTARRIVAAFHAGWRGTVARIVEHGVARMQREFGSRPESLMAAVGPSIGACCYIVGAEVHERLPYQLSLRRRSVPAGAGTAQYTLDLWEANRRQLVAAGVAVERITVVGSARLCRAAWGAALLLASLESGFTGRMLSVIGVDGSAECTMTRLDLIYRPPGVIERSRDSSGRWELVTGEGAESRLARRFYPCKLLSGAHSEKTIRS